MLFTVLYTEIVDKFKTLEKRFIDASDSCSTDSAIIAGVPRFYRIMGTINPIAMVKLIGAIGNKFLNRLVVMIRLH